MVLYRLHTTHRGNIEDTKHITTDKKHMHKQRKIKHEMKRKCKRLTRLFDAILADKRQITLNAVYFINMELQSYSRKNDMIKLWI